jgi:hypothetical protein
VGNEDGRLSGLIYPNEEIEVYLGYNQSTKVFTGLADTITTDQDGLSFKAYDNLALLRQEYITEEHQSEWRNTDVGVIIREVVEGSLWAPSANYIRTDTGIIVGRVNLRWLSRLEALNRLVELANSGPKKYVLYCDGSGNINFRRYDDDTFPVAFITTEEEFDHVVQDINDAYTRALYFFGESEDVGGNDTLYDESMYENDMVLTHPTIAGKHRTRKLSRKFDGTNDYGTVSGDSSLNIFSGQSFTVDLLFYPLTLNSSPNWNILNIQSGSNIFSIYVRDDSTRIQIRTDQPGTWQWDASVSWDTNEWNYLTLVVDNNDVYLYKNGTLSLGTSQSSYNWTGSGSDGFYVGDDGASPGTWPFDGYIDLLRLSDKAYSSREIYNYTRIQTSDLLLSSISKTEMGGEKYNHCIVKYTDDIWAEYPSPAPSTPITKFISTSTERTNHDCYLRARAVVQSHTEVPTRYKASAYSSRVDYFPNDLVEVYAPRLGIEGNFRLKSLTYTVRDGIRKMDMTLDRESRELTKLLAIAGL